MDADIKLQDDALVLEGRVLRSTATDLMLDNPARRPPEWDEATHRRALVHGHGDRLVLNYEGDYSGGTRVDTGLALGGGLHVEGAVSADHLLEVHAQGGLEIRGWDLRLDDPVRRAPKGGKPARPDEGSMRRALVHSSGDTLVINYEGDYAGAVRVDSDVHVKGDVVMVLTEGEESVAGGLQALRAQIEELQQRVDHLESVVSEG